MELMSTCLDKLLKRTHKPIPERILGKMAVAVSFCILYYLNMDVCVCVGRFDAPCVIF